MGKILILSFRDNEEQIFQQTVEWLSRKLSTTPATLIEQKSDLTINIFTRTVTDKNGNHLYLTFKEFDLLNFLYSYKGQVFTKEQLYENVWGYDYAPDAKNLTSFIRKLRKKIELIQTIRSTLLRSGVLGINSQRVYKSKVDCDNHDTLLLQFIFY